LNSWNTIKVKIVVIVTCLILSISTFAKADEQEDLAKESQNPIGNIISLPFENNFDFGVGPEDAFVYKLNIKPVYPLNFGNVNLINRFILPVIYQEERVEGEDSEFGLGDFTYQAFLSPAKPGKVIWGAGPAFVFPTNTNDRLGVDKWSAGPAVVALAKPGPWLVGALIQNVWSYAGDSDAPDVNFFSFQYFINYNFKSGWYISSTPTITADWEADSDDRWTVPFGGGFGKLVRFGQQPVDVKAQAFVNAVKPDGASDWALQLQVKLLFPK
jgi:Putative MetA-pathway of phenol degradation